MLITYRVVLISIHTHPERENVTAVTFDRGDETERQMHTNRCTALRYAHEGQHGRGAPSTDPDSEEDN